MRYEELTAAYEKNLATGTAGWRETAILTAAHAVIESLDKIASAILGLRPEPPALRPQVQASVHTGQKPKPSVDLTEEQSQHTDTTFTRPKRRGPVVMPRLLDAG